MPTYQYQPTQAQINDMLNRAEDDYKWKSDLVREQTGRLDAWEAAHWGDLIITPNAFNQYKTFTDEFIKREKDYRSSAQNFKDLVLKYSNYFTPESVQINIDNIDQNIQISKNDQQAAIYNYQQIEAKYLNQEQIGTTATGGGLAIAGLGLLLWAVHKYGKMIEKGQQKAPTGFTKRTTETYRGYIER